MNCYICSESDWHSLSHLNPERELQVCKKCGNVAYKVDAADEGKVREYYRTAYRPEPTFENILTTNRKLNYIRLFLKDFLQGKKGLLVGDVGCATGYIPNWFRQIGHKATGCELTLTYRRFAENYYGFPIPEELPVKHKYDLIVIYHVLEHLIQPDKKLLHYASLLAEGGHIMVATPEWLDTLEEASGSKTNSFTHLFHKDHINVFTKESLQALFQKCGLEVVKENHIQYGQTYLLKQIPVKINGFDSRETWEEVVKKIETQKKAIDLFAQRKWQEAIDLWPKYPEAWLSLIYEKYGKDPDAQKEFYEKGLIACPQNVRLNMGYAQWLYGQQKYEKAAQVLEWLEGIRPNEDIYFFLGWCYSFLGRPELAMRSFDNAWKINPMRWVEAQNAMCQTAARMPTWDEKAVAALMKETVKTLPRPEFSDPVLETK